MTALRATPAAATIIGRRAADPYTTAAATLALAERHGCSQLQARCIEFIAGGSREDLDAVLETEGFKDLMVNSPSLLIQVYLSRWMDLEAISG